LTIKRKRFPVEQIVAILKQAELDMQVGDIVGQIGNSEQTFTAGAGITPACKWKLSASSSNCRRKTIASRDDTVRLRSEGCGDSMTIKKF